MKFSGRGGVVSSRALVVWRGAFADGAIPGSSGGLGESPYSLTTRFERGSRNPEEMMAAAHAGCFTAALAYVSRVAAVQP